MSIKPYKVSTIKNLHPSNNHAGSIFPALSLDRNVIRWEDFMYTWTPVQKVGELFFKREDFWSPLGSGSINGSKARQALFLAYKMYEKGCEGICTGASLLSPQHAITAAMAKHFDMQSLHVVGATTPESSSKHPSVAIAKLLGAKFDYIGSAYNNSLQPRVDKLVNEARQHGHYWDKIEYGITLEHSKHPPELIQQFHLVGARQVANLPEEMETLIIPAGSCNTFVSIMYGLAACNLVKKNAPHPNLKKIIAVGIGPSRLGWAEERLAIISNVVNYEAGEYLYRNDVEFEYIDLHRMGVYTYADKVFAEYEDIKFHPTYESKIFTWLKKHRPSELFSPKTVFWIVGGEPSLEATKRAIGV